MTSFVLNAGMKCTLLPGIRHLYQLKSLRCVSTSESVTEKGKEESVKSAYHPSEVEANWYELWESRNYFKPSKSETDSFVILLPPPNITGTLHLGHALTCTIQDVILRWKRMKGESVLWIPGIDHAGIATQCVVEKHLTQTSGLSRHELGREKFVKTIWDWKDEKGTKIIEQLRRMGASLDWSKLIFTMDPSHCDLVKKCFIQLYNDGLIYRKEHLVNWSCALGSSISNIEVDWIKINGETSINVPGYKNPIKFGKLYEFAYKVIGEDDEIIVSTTRPETMLGDVAIAIHPDNPAHSKFKDKFVWHPFRDMKIPVIVDEFVDRNFGTGAVKITPSHSLIDFDVALKHNLKSIPVINEEGLINEVGANGSFHGLKRFDAREAVLKELKNLNLYRGSKSHEMTLPVCSRSGDVIEFLLKDQWFLKCDSLVEESVKVVKNGDLEITPESYKNVWYDWMKDSNTRDWNLSRQLWWGHQIPMYECRHKEKTIWVPGLSLEEAKSKASEEFGAPASDINVVQDPDVLDTWFSSGLLSLNAVIDQKRKPPISLMVTGHDILFFWLSRMVMLSIQLTGELPFKKVFLHGLLFNGEGKKMSKSAGNVIDPDDIINGLTKSEMENRVRRSLPKGQISEKSVKKALASQNKLFPEGIPECGVDALRFTLCSGTIQGFFTNFRVDKCVANRFFCNKIYQGFNYFTKIADAYKEKRREFDLEDPRSEKGKLNCFDLWILSRLANVIESVDRNLASYEFNTAADDIRTFITDEFCNTYLTSTKPILENCSSSQFKTTISVFFHCFENFLRLVSPVMPFLTEHLYQKMPSFNGYEKWESITVAKFPTADDWNEFRDVDLERRLGRIFEFLSALRRITMYLRLGKEKPNALTKCPNEVAELLFSEMKFVFLNLGRVRDLKRVEDFQERNVVRQEVDEGFVAFVEHDFDKTTLASIFQPLTKKEDELKRSLQKLKNTLNDQKNEKMGVNAMLRLKKEINDVNKELKKIGELKFSVNNCDR